MKIQIEKLSGHSSHSKIYLKIGKSSFQIVTFAQSSINLSIAIKLSFCYNLMT